MAGDWIKMRSALRSSPKVVRIASALNADRLRVVGALHAVWSLADEHSEDGRLDGYTLESLDELIGWAGFSAAMKSVEWLMLDAQGIEVPRFEEHNGASAKRRAMESERKRRGRGEGGQTSASHADKKRPREEKRRVKETPLPPLKFPDGITEQDWKALRDHRQKLRKPMTAKAEQLAVAKLHDLVRQGYDATKLLNRAIESGWLTFYAHDDCRAGMSAVPGRAVDLGNCQCGAPATVRVGGKPRCGAHIRHDFQPAAKAA